MKHVSTLILIFMAHISSSQWPDTSLYPFENKFMDLPDGRLHYIDEGNGEVILFVHGTPTWSFLYREHVTKLSENYRCIAIDHLGFGLSDKPGVSDYTPQKHAANLSTFIQKMDLKNITLVVHDFGGPIGLAAGIENHERIRRIVLFNSWLWETKSNPEVRKVDKLVSGWLGKFLYLRMNVSPKVLLKKGFSDQKKLSKAVHKHYICPFPNKTSRIPLLDLAKSLAGSSDWYHEQWFKLDSLADKPWLILWGNSDTFITTDYLQKWQERLPEAKTITFPCGHFVQEEKTSETIDAIATFMVD